jgi:hypothetical protein
VCRLGLCDGLQVDAEGKRTNSLRFSSTRAAEFVARWIRRTMACTSARMTPDMQRTQCAEKRSMVAMWAVAAPVRAVPGQMRGQGRRAPTSWGLATTRLPDEARTPCTRHLVQGRPITWPLLGHSIN